MGLSGLYAITPEHPRAGLSLALQVKQAAVGGARVIQYRDKSGDREKRRMEAASVLDVCRHYGVLFIVNDDVALAATIGADGVHLGQDDETLARARLTLDEGALIGISCYDSLERARRAEALGADYVAFGRFFPSTSKPGAVPADPQLLERARALIRLPIVAIGGITPQNGGPLIRAGADMLAAIDAVFGRGDIRAAAHSFAQLFPTEEPR